MTATNIIVDKICIRYMYECSFESVDEYQQLHHFKSSVKDGSLGSKGKTWMAAKAPITYMALPLPSGATLMVRYGFARGRHWAWIEFNPSRLTVHDLDVLSGCLSLLFVQGAATIWHKGRIARLDLAIDAEPVKFDACQFLDQRLRCSQHCFDAKGSTYLGSKNGKKSILLYDKAKELWDKSKIVCEEPRLRLEARLYDPKRWSFNEVANVGNPFMGLMVLDKEALLATDCTTLHPARLRMEQGEPLDCIYWGSAKPDRPEVWSSLQELQASWWNPLAIWNSYGDALKWVPQLLQPYICELPMSA